MTLALIAREFNQPISEVKKLRLWEYVTLQEHLLEETKRIKSRLPTIT